MNNSEHDKKLHESVDDVLFANADDNQQEKMLNEFYKKANKYDGLIWQMLESGYLQTLIEKIHRQWVFGDFGIAVCHKVLYEIVHDEWEYMLRKEATKVINGKMWIDRVLGR